MPSKKPRVNLTLGKRLSAAATKAGRRRGMNTTAFARSVLVERLLTDGDITEAELELDESEDEPAKADPPLRTAP